MRFAKRSQAAGPKKGSLAERFLLFPYHMQFKAFFARKAGCGQTACCRRAWRGGKGGPAFLQDRHRWRESRCGQEGGGGAAAQGGYARMGRFLWKGPLSRIHAWIGSGCVRRRGRRCLHPYHRGDRRKGRPVGAWPAGLVMVPAGLASFETSTPEAGRQEAGGTEKRLRGD